MNFKKISALLSDKCNLPWVPAGPRGLYIGPVLMDQILSLGVYILSNLKEQTFFGFGHCGNYESEHVIICIIEL